ncbi:MAG: hypothetical protein QM763_03800 [Agriterribacter sp.]
MRQNIIILSAVLLLSGCAPSIKTNITSPEKPLTINDKVAFLDIKHKVPETAKKVGAAKLGDSGFSTNCDFNSNLVKARDLARKSGANIVKVVETKKPDLWSSCYRMKIEFYKYDGDVTTLPQYQLQIN